MRRLITAAAVVCVWVLSGPIGALAASPAITLSTSSGQTGTSIDVRGTGFPPNEIVALYIDQPGPYLSFPGPRADGSGSFHMTFAWPPKTFDKSGHVDPTKPGPHLVCGDTGYPGSSQAVAVKACTQFLVNGTASPSASPGSPGNVPIVVIVVAVVVLIGLAVSIWLTLRSPR